MEAAQTSRSGKLRVMCSYGGQILPRPRTTSFWYVGGDTRILSMDHSTVTTLSSLVSHLSSALSLTSPFSVKYQLPHLDLDSLISLASDDDLHILIDEHNRLSSSRIRLFLFPLIPHPKTESWFFDALNSAAIMQNSMHHHHHFPSPPAPDSMLLETTSSFGSSSSSTSFTNLPPLRVPHPDDNDALFKFSSSDTIPSENSVSSIVSPQQNIISYQYHDPVEEARLSAAESSIEVETKSMPSSGVMANINTNVDNMGPSSFPQLNQVVVERPHLQFVQAAAHFQPSCHQLVYQPVPPPPRPLQHLVYHHHPNQPSPLYLVPIIGNMPPKPNSLPIISASGQASLNLNASPLNYLTAANATTSLVYVPCNGSLQQREIMDSYPMNQKAQNVSVVTSMESPKYGSNELDDEIARVQIYKSQPPPPTNMHSKYQTMTKDTTNLLSAALTQLHVDNLKQQITETSQPQ